jgi:hypothetical protein
MAVPGSLRSLPAASGTLSDVNWWILGVIAAVVVALVVAAKAGWIDLSNKTQRGSGGYGGVTGVVDEVFAPARHEAQQELDRQTMLPAPAPVPGDGGDGMWEGGKITIDVGSAGRGQRAGGRAPGEQGRSMSAAAESRRR